MNSSKQKSAIKRYFSGAITVAVVMALPLTAKALEAKTESVCNKGLNPKTQLCGECKYGEVDGRWWSEPLELCLPCS